MRAITCPEVYVPQFGDVAIFLAGGISNCFDWQSTFIEEMNELGFGDSLVLINPRRDDFDITNPNMTVEQIHWEHKHLQMSNIVSFWFPSETLCPITLFELGVHASSNKPIYVGTDPEYKRRVDVEVQLSLMTPRIIGYSEQITVYADMYELIDRIGCDLEVYFNL